MLPVAVTQSSSGGLVVHFVLPVLMMTSCFPIMHAMTVRFYCSSLIAAQYWLCLPRQQRVITLDDPFI